MAKILVVDGDLASNVVLAKTLTNDGHVTRTAFNGDEAIRRFTSERFDLLITDIAMPKVDGIEMLGRLRAQGLLESVPFLICTARAEREIYRIANEVGATDVIPKPLDPAVVQLRVRRALDKHKQQQGAADPATPVPPPPPATTFALPGTAPGPLVVPYAGPAAQPPAAAPPGFVPAPYPDLVAALTGAGPPDGPADAPTVILSHALSGDALPGHASPGAQPGSGVRPPPAAGEGAVVGQLGPLVPAELVRLLFLGRKTGLLLIDHDDYHAEVAFYVGEVVRAVVTYQGAEVARSLIALRTACGFTTGGFRILFRDVPHSGTVMKTTAAFLAEAFGGVRGC